MTIYTTQYDAAIQAAIATHWPTCPDWRWGRAQLIAESGLDPNATSSAGAEGLAQFLPNTWNDMTRDLGWNEPDWIPLPTDPTYAIPAYAEYMRQLWSEWTNPKRSAIDRLRLAQASYNAGLGNLLKAQRLAQGAIEYDAIVRALPRVTGPTNARQTTDYVARIARIYAQLAAG